jgi:hypothetical protein
LATRIGDIYRSCFNYIPMVIDDTGELYRRRASIETDHLITKKLLNVQTLTKEFDSLGLPNNDKYLYTYRSSIHRVLETSGIWNNTMWTYKMNDSEQNVNFKVFEKKLDQNTHRELVNNVVDIPLTIKLQNIKSSQSKEARSHAIENLKNIVNDPSLNFPTNNLSGAVDLVYKAAQNSIESSGNTIDSLFYNGEDREITIQKNVISVLKLVKENGTLERFTSLTSKLEVVKTNFLKECLQKEFLSTEYPYSLIGNTIPNVLGAVTQIPFIQNLPILQCWKTIAEILFKIMSKKEFKKDEEEKESIQRKGLFLEWTILSLKEYEQDFLTILLKCATICQLVLLKNVNPSTKQTILDEIQKSQPTFVKLRDTTCKSIQENFSDIYRKKDWTCLTNTLFDT